MIDIKLNTFNSYWNQEFANLLPFGHELRHHFPERWFRIHSLPKSKRYADTEEEYQIILDRQNRLFETIVGEGTEILLVFGLYTNDVINGNYGKVIDYKEFTKEVTIHLHQIDPENFEENICLEVFVGYTKWYKNGYNEILKAIADDKIRMLFVCPSKKRIIAPYDGGVDVIMEDQSTRNEMSIVYKDWLSCRKDGF